MKKFKYCVGGLPKTSSPEEQQKILGKMGEDGFELVSVVRDGKVNGYIMFYFKKEVEEYIKDEVFRG